MDPFWGPQIHYVMFMFPVQVAFFMLSYSCSQCHGLMFMYSCSSSHSCVPFRCTMVLFASPWSIYALPCPHVHVCMCMLSLHVCVFMCTCSCFNAHVFTFMFSLSWFHVRNHVPMFMNPCFIFRIPRFIPMFTWNTRLCSISVFEVISMFQGSPFLFCMFTCPCSHGHVPTLKFHAASPCSGFVCPYTCIHCRHAYLFSLPIHVSMFASSWSHLLVDVVMYMLTCSDVCVPMLI